MFGSRSTKFNLTISQWKSTEVSDRDQQREAAQGGDLDFFSGDIANPPGHLPVWPYLGKPVLAGRLGSMVSIYLFQPIEFYDSVWDV